MAIKYLDAKRIRGSSTASKSSTYSGDLGTWATEGSQVTESSDVVTMNISTRVANHTVSNDLGSTLSDSEWVMRCKVVFTTLTHGGGSTIFLELGVGSANASTDFANGGITSDFIGLQMRTVNSNRGWGCVGYNSTGNLDNPENNGVNTNEHNFATDSTTGTYYVEIKRLSTTSMSIGLYSDSSFETLIDPILTRTISSGVTSLQYLRVGNATVGSESSTGNVIGGTVSEFEIWNSTTSATTNDKATLLTAAPTKSATFDGSNDKVTAGGTASTYGFLTGNGGSDWSLACWLKPTITHQDVFFDQCNGETAGIGVSFRFNVSGSEKRVQCGLSDGSTFSFFESGNVWTDGVWQHMCVTYDSSASTMTIYRNGVSAGSSSSVPSNNGTPTHAFTIGEAGAGNDNAYEGYISDLLLTDDILSSTEISALASGTAVSNVSPTIDNQELHYTFSENFNDSSGQSGRNGTASGTVIGTGGGTSPLNASSNLAENTLFEETDTYKTYWLQDDKWNESGALPATYMVLIGGSSTSDIQRITVATTGSAEDFGDLSPARANCAGCANETRALCAGGEPSGSSTEDINYITIATKSNSSDFGDLMAADQRQGGLQAIDIDRGLFAGGLSDNTNIQYVTVSTTGDATDFGNLNTGSYYNGTAWSATRGLICSGHNTNRIDYITMATPSNATDFGDLYEAKYSLAGITNLTRGVFCGGYETDTTGSVKRCDYVTIATPSNATEWGDCIAAGSGLQDHFSGGDLKTNGILAGGYDGVSTTNVIQTTTIATGSSFSDWGDLVQAKNDGASANGS